MEELKRLQELRAKLAAEIRALAATQENWNAEDKAKWDTLNKSYDETMTSLDAVKKSITDREEIQNRLSAIDSYQNYNPRIGRDGATLDDRTPRGGQAPGEKSPELWSLAVQGWMRSQYDDEEAGPITDQHKAAAAACGVSLSKKGLIVNLNANFREVRNTLSGQTGSSGGFTYGDTFVNNLERAMLAYGAMFNVAEVIRTSTGEPLRWPTANDTTNTGRQIGESNAPATNVDPTFTQSVWNAYKFTSEEILVPYELLRDNAINLAAILPQMLGERLGRIQNTKYTVGSGANTPHGIVNRAYAGVTAVSATSIAFDELIDLEHSLDPSRRKMPGVGYMLHDNVLKALRKLKDGEARYLWQSGANSGAPDTLNGYTYTINQDMASSIATGAITVLFGQMPSYKIRQVGEIRMYRLVERHRENDQDAFMAFIAGDGNLLDAGDHPVRKLTQG